LKRKFTVHFELTSTCQAACPNCARNVGGVELPWLGKTELRLPDVKKILQGTQLVKQSDILYCGTHGDPAAAKDLLPIIEWIQDQPYEAGNKRRQQINTNGGLRDKDFWNRLGKHFNKQHDRGHVVFSIDGLEDTNHIYRKGVSWSRVWENLNAYVNAGGEAVWDYLMFGHNKHQVDEAERIAKSMGITFVKKRPHGFDQTAGQLDSEQHMHTYDTNGNYEYSISKDTDVVYFEEEENSKPGANLSRVQNSGITLTEKENNYSKESKIRCKSLSRGTDRTVFSQDIYVKSDGHLLPCCHMDVVTTTNSYNFGHQQMKDTVAGIYNMLDVVNNDIDKMIESDTFKKTFFDTQILESAEEGKPMFCVDTCGGNTPRDMLFTAHQDSNNATATKLSKLLGL